MSYEYQQSVFEPERWGLSTESTQDLAHRLSGLWQRFREWFKTKTRDTSEYAYSYMSGQLRMTGKRNFANIGCNTGVTEQNMQHFMSNSPWSAWAVIQQVQVEIAATPGLGQGGVLILDESANKKAGDKSAKCQRYFVERANQDAKSELGWDELEAQKYLAWTHHLALTILALWFITQTKIEWAEQYARDPALLQQFEVDVLPALSTANVRALLRAVMPLPQLTPAEAGAQVAKYLVNRTRSRKSRMKGKHRGP